MTRHLTFALVCGSLVCASIGGGPIGSGAIGGGSVVLHASDWMRFRGPNGTGVSTDRGLPVVIDRDKGVLWSAKLPKGSSSPVVAQGRVYVTAYEGDQRFVLCYDAATGQERWRLSVRRPREERFHSAHGPATPTPATDGGRVFAYLPEVGLLAFDRDGRELWRVPLGPFASVHGMASSPIYVAGRVVLFVDTPVESFVIAFDAATGRQAWKAERTPGAMGSFTTPTLYAEDSERAQIIVAGAEELTGYLAATGERVWWARGVSITPAAPPFVSGDSVYSLEPPGTGDMPAFGELARRFDTNKDQRITQAEAAGDLFWAETFKGLDLRRGNGDGAVTEDEFKRAAFGGPQSGGLVRTRLGGRGDVGGTHIMWRYDKALPYFTGALLYDGVLYTLRNGTLTTFSPQTGAMLKQQRVMNALGEYYASPIAGDGKIYLVNLEGQVTVVKAGAEWDVLSTGELHERVTATPAIADGRVYIRTDGTLYCFGPSTNASTNPPTKG